MPGTRLFSDRLTKNRGPPNVPAQLLVAEKRFRKIDAPHLAVQVYRGVVFEDGLKLTKQNQRVAP